ncbi:MAG TPA: hypothetical protein VN625_03735 [Desulfuromonadaceae bacterium]|nr:hypothetical protein [Desulfuromonadaceae bacterium]
MAAAELTQAEEAQLNQTIEMFEVIVQSQPNDCQSLEILKEAYTKLGREQDVIRISKRIAEAYTEMGQLSSAILEYETVLQRKPDDADVQTALRTIEDKASNAVAQAPAVESVASAPQAPPPSDGTQTRMRKLKAASDEFDDGQKTMRKIFVENKFISAGDFDLCWRKPEMMTTPTDVVEPFIQTLHDKNIFHIEKSLKLLSDKSRMAYLPLEKYETDLELLRSFPPELCRRWCIAPFDRMSKAVLVATANPFNQQAAKELSEVTTQRLLWYLVTPLELVILLRKVFR